LTNRQLIVTTGTERMEMSKMIPPTFDEKIAHFGPLTKKNYRPAHDQHCAFWRRLQ